MSLQPTVTHWFETLTPREQTVYALEALTATGQVELAGGLVDRPLIDTVELRSTVRWADQLLQRYATMLPEVGAGRHLVTESPESSARSALLIVRHWLAQQLCATRRLRACQRRQQKLELLRECLEAMGDAASDLAGFVGSGPFLFKRIYALPGDAPLPEPFASANSYAVFRGPRHVFHAVACLPERRTDCEQVFHTPGSEVVDLPGWSHAHWSKRNTLIEQQIDGLSVTAIALQRTLEERLRDPWLKKALADLALLRWYLGHTLTLSADARHCHVTGWTTAESPEVLQQALKRAGINAKILFRPLPPGQDAPVHLNKGGLATLFRQFVDMHGTPGGDELDPAPLLAVIVPLLFGFMFPDVGHGLVLVAAGTALWKRQPRLRCLVPCGLAATAFGALFGETFGLRGPVPGVLGDILERPLELLLASLLLGAAIILLGLALSAIEAHWRGTLRRWMWLDAAVLTLYLSLLIGFVHPAALWFAGIALGWYLMGLIRIERRQFWQGIGRLAQSALELSMNTLSFARVGAFALAHTALSHAVLELAAMPDNKVMQIVLLLCGHLALIVVEALVVFVQTTRLVLFEFFTRFLRADGRLFRASATPGDVQRRP